jgi:D-arabinono-1,4-lactone oxidase
MTPAELSEPWFRKVLRLRSPRPELRDLYPSGLPYTLFEVRFTPAGHDRTLIGAGRERRFTWIDIVCNDSDGFEAHYAAAVRLIKELGGRPHLGKYCNGFDMKYLHKFHEEYFEAFRRVMVRHDPCRQVLKRIHRAAFRPKAGRLTDTHAA